MTKNKPRARGVEPHAGPFKGGAELRVEAEKRAIQNAQLENPLAQEFANAFRENFFGGHEIFIPRGLKVLAAGRICIASRWAMTKQLDDLDQESTWLQMVTGKKGDVA